MADNILGADQRTPDSLSGSTPSGRTRTSKTVMSAIEKLDDARSISVLLAWIENARGICDFVQFLAERDNAFAERLRDNDIAYASGMWDSPESAALGWLHSQQLIVVQEAQSVLTKDAHHG
jgi:hypothetical protein